MIIEFAGFGWQWRFKFIGMDEISSSVKIRLFKLNPPTFALIFKVVSFSIVIFPRLTILQPLLHPFVFGIFIGPIEDESFISRDSFVPLENDATSADNLKFPGFLGLIV